MIPQEEESCRLLVLPKTMENIAALHGLTTHSAINAPATRQKLIDFGIEPIGSTPQQYSDLIRTETVRWHKLIKAQSISLD